MSVKVRRVVLGHSFLRGRDAGQAVVDERNIIADILEWHGLKSAARATRNGSSFNDFMTSRGAMLAGGLHLVRLRGGRGIVR